MTILDFRRYSLGLCAVAILAGCGGSQSPIAAPGTAGQGAAHGPPPSTGNPKELAISEWTASPYFAAVAILNNVFKPVRTITTGLTCPRGDWIDAHGTLYVADYCKPRAGAVQEYPAGKSAPSFTYTGTLMGVHPCLGDTINVTTDSADHVYAVDDNGNSPCGAYLNVFEFPQHKNKPIAYCTPTTILSLGAGVAIDSTGDVFVSFNGPSSSGGYIDEYVGGLRGCPATALGVTFTSVGGLQVDKHDNLVVADTGAGTVDIIAPPYSSITSAIPGFSMPTNVALNKKQTELFVADHGTGVVDVLAYPSGAPITVLGASRGVTEPWGVAAFPQR
jgi:hypothetical protein